jgi:hypothetical protein
MMIVPMVVDVPVIIMAFFFFSMNADADVVSGNAALYGRFHPHRYTGNAQRIQFSNKFCGIVQKRRQSAQKHITGRAHTALQI